MRVVVLGSGSGGNATLVEANGVRILVDAGFSGRDLTRRLEEAEIAPESLGALVITHEHGDHTRGMGVLARRFGLPIHLTSATASACRRRLSGREDLRTYRPSVAFRIGPLEIQPFLTAHDAVDPVAVTVTDVDHGHKLGIATDLGRPTAAVLHALSGCHLLVLEANHDEVMLRAGPYPWSVKSRIASSHGHLSNDAAARLARDLFHTELGGVILAHLSDSCNDPSLAATVVGAALERVGYRGGLDVAPQERPMEPMDVAAMRQQVKPTQLSLF